MTQIQVDGQLWGDEAAVTSHLTSKYAAAFGLKIRRRGLRWWVIRVGHPTVEYRGRRKQQADRTA